MSCIGKVLLALVQAGAWVLWSLVTASKTTPASFSLRRGGEAMIHPSEPGLTDPLFPQDPWFGTPE